MIVVPFLLSSKKLNFFLLEKWYFPIAISVLVVFNQNQYNRTNQRILYEKRPKPCVLMHTGRLADIIA